MEIKRGHIYERAPCHELQTNIVSADRPDMARNDSSIRLFKVLHYLETSKYGLTINELLKKLEDLDNIKVSRKTVERDVECIRDAHFDLESEKTTDGQRWKVKPLTQLNKNIVFTYKEIMAHYLARKYLDHLKGSPLYEDLDKFFTKLEKLFGTNCEAFSEFEQNMQFKPKMTWHNSVPADVLDTVYEALEEGHSLKFEYKAEAGENAGEFAIRHVGPECLYFADAGVYLIAKDLSKNEPRTYALARMKNIEDNHEYPYDREGITPGELFKNSIGVLNTGDTQEVEILLTGPIAKYISERKWHESQKIIQRSDGTHLVMNVKVNDELVRWVLGLGESAIVLKSDKLKDMVIDAIDALSKNYKIRESA